MHLQKEQQKFLLPKVGQFVRVKKQRTHKDPADIRDPQRLEIILAEGLVTSTLFDENFEVSYIVDEKPTSHWYNLQEISALEVL